MSENVSLHYKVGAFHLVRTQFYMLSEPTHPLFACNTQWKCIGGLSPPPPPPPPPPRCVRTKWKAPYEKYRRGEAGNPPAPPKCPLRWIRTLHSLWLGQNTPYSMFSLNHNLHVQPQSTYTLLKDRHCWCGMLCGTRNKKPYCRIITQIKYISNSSQVCTGI